MLDPRSLRLAVALADIRGQMDFGSSLRHWQLKAPERSDDWLRSLRPQTTPLAVSGREVVEVADCQADVVANDSVVHVYGDLGGQLTANGQCEVIVAGDITPDGAIHGDGIIHIYVGGSVHGEVVNKRSSSVWIHGELRGRIGTGLPSTRLWVLGDCGGEISPLEKAALLFLEVEGFMPFELLEQVAAAEYTQFNAVVHRSDRPPGFYPDRVADRPPFNRWVVFAEGRQGPAEPRAAPGPTRVQPADDA